MSENLLGQRLAERHKENGPINGVEAQNVFTYQMQIRRPIFFIIFAVIAVRVVADPRDIVGERIKPNVNDVLVVKFHGYAPRKRRARNAKILQAFQKEIVHHFVLARYRLNKLGVGVDMLDKPIGVFAHFEEIRFFFRRLHFPSAIGAFAFYKLAFRPEGFAGRAIHALIVTLINIPLIVKLFENFRNLFHVIGVRRAHKFVIGRAHKVPNVLDLARDFIDVCLRRYPHSLRLFLNFLTVFVRSRLEKHVVALLTLKPRDRVRQNRFVRVADMRLARSVGDCRRDIVRFFCHVRLLPYDLLFFFVIYYTTFLWKSKLFSTRVGHFPRPRGI